MRSQFLLLPGLQQLAQQDTSGNHDSLKNHDSLIKAENQLLGAKFIFLMQIASICTAETETCYHGRAIKVKELQ